MSLRNAHPGEGDGGEGLPILSALKQMTARPKTYPLMWAPGPRRASRDCLEHFMLRPNERPGFQKVVVALSKR